MSEATNLKHLTTQQWLELQEDDFPFTADVVEARVKVFKIDKLRDQQDAIVNAALCGQNVFVLMPTGGGKSLCYQLPAVAVPGTTIVVSPLLSLINDQVKALTALGVSAVALTSMGSAPSEIMQSETLPKLVYVTPERLASETFLKALDDAYREKKLQRFAIDEGHCLSAWGHDFRPQYGALSVLSRRYPDIPIMALTGTASNAVQRDIFTQLGFYERGFVQFKSSLNRPNLHYSVLPKSWNGVSKVMFDRIVTLGYIDSTGIVYCFSKADCEAVAKDLNRFYAERLSSSPNAKMPPNMIKYASAYHSESADRPGVQQAWMENRILIVCATISFGMGVNKPDVRFVYHHTIPQNLEGYSQASGRAGRDGLPGECVLFFDKYDANRVLSLITDQKNNNENRARMGFAAVTDERVAKIKKEFEAMVNYCTDKHTCRRKLQLVQFDEVFDSKQCSGCDNCESAINNSDGKRQRTLDSYFHKK